MSNIYIAEPPTSGKVLLKTTKGDIDIELWSKETPQTCRNFIQLCMEGFYDDVIFHRIVKDFIVQTGDPTGTGLGGESIYGKPFKDEFHQRLKFTRRGLVGMANTKPNDNESQFFITLDAAGELNGKHTMFGKVTGNTIFNVLQIGEVPTNAQERPNDPPKIIEVEILNNPFDDIEPRTTREERMRQEEEFRAERLKAKKRSKMKAAKNFNALSFGDEAEEEEAEILKATTKIGKVKSSHDIAEDPTLSAVPISVENPSDDGDDGHEGDVARAAKKLKRDAPKPQSDTKDQKSAAEKMQDELKKRARKRHRGERDTAEARIKESKSEAQKLRDEIIAARAAAMKGDDSDSDGPITSGAAFLAEQRDIYKAKCVPKQSKKDRQDLTMQMLMKFQSKLSKAPKVAPKEEKDDDENDEGWLGHKLVEDKEPDPTVGIDPELDPNRLELHDPRNPLNVRRREKSHKHRNKEHRKDKHRERSSRSNR